MRRITVLTTVLAVALAGLVVPTPAAVAQVQDNLACPGWIPASGFTDVDPASVHSRDIDCITFYEITVSTGQFNPKQNVSRVQMALFLMRTLKVQWDAEFIDENWGFDQGFVDIAGLPADQQAAINQLKQFSITSGITPTTFGPLGAVTRSQMALFLTRELRAMGVALPDGADQGFTDIGGLSAEAQQAINQLRQLGITAGTSPTTFSPNDTVTREQMASFLARLLNSAWDLDDYLAWSGMWSCDEQETNCTGSGTFPANRTFVIREGWIAGPLPLLPELQNSLFTSSFRVEVTWNARELALTERAVALNDVVFKYYEAVFQGGLTGNATIEIRYYEDDQLASRFAWSVLFVE